MNNSKSFKFALGVLPLLGLLASCGPTAAATSSEKSGSSEPASSVVSPNTSGALPVPTADNVVIEFWATGSQGMNTQLQAMAEKFSTAIKQNTGKTVTVKISTEGGYDDIANKINKGIAVGSVPTMAVAYPDTVANILASEPTPGAYVYNLDDYMDDANVGFTKQSYLGDTSKATKKDIVPSFLEEGSSYIREGTYSLSFMKSSEVMFYNRNYLQSAYKFYKPSITTIGKAEEDLKSLSWDEFMDLCKVVNEHKSEIVSSLELPLWYDSDSNLFISQLYQRGIGYTSIDKDGKGVIDFEDGLNRTNAEAVVSNLVDAHNKNLITTKGVVNKYGSDYFKSSKVLFSVGSSGGTGYNMPEDANPEDIGVCAVPAANDNPLYVSQGPTLTFLKNKSVNDEVNDARMYYGWQFAKYLTNPDNNVTLCVRGSQGYLPIRYSAYTTPTYIDYLEESEIYGASAKVLINEIQGNYYNAPCFPGSAQLRDQVGGIITQCLSGTKTVTEAFDVAIAQTKTYMK